MYKTRIVGNHLKPTYIQSKNVQQNFVTNNDTQIEHRGVNQPMLRQIFVTVSFYSFATMVIEPNDFDMILYICIMIGSIFYSNFKQNILK
jgi:hypothetical protein